MQPTKVARWSFGAPTFTNKKLFDSSPTILFTAKLKRISPLRTKNQLKKPYMTLFPNKNYLLLPKISLSLLLELQSFISNLKFINPENPGRPIVSAYSCPTELISQYLDQIMSPFVKLLPSYIKDTNHALKTFRDFNFPGQNKLIFTMDITSLYTVIPNHEGLLALKYFFDQRANKEPSTETLIRLAEFVLTPNCLSFSDNYYMQINGVAIGTKMGPSYANLFVGFIEQQFFDKFDGTKSELYRRYIDDCFGATSCSRQELDYFITSVNSFHPALKYTWVVSECSIAFLDTNVSISGNRLSTSVHYKPTDSHSYLLHSSSHPAHVKNSIPYSQFLRLRRLCSDDTDFSEKAEEMCQFFKTRGYPDPVIHNSKHRAQSVHPQSAPLSSHNKLQEKTHSHSHFTHITFQSKTSS